MLRRVYLPQDPQPTTHDPQGWGDGQVPGKPLLINPSQEANHCFSGLRSCWVSWLRLPQVWTGSTTFGGGVQVSACPRSRGLADAGFLRATRLHRPSQWFQRELAAVEVAPV